MLGGRRGLGAMIRKTLQATKDATWAVGLYVRGQGLAPAGSGFFVGDDGLFATAAHVIREARPVSIIKAQQSDELPSLDVKDVVFCDDNADFALLRVAPHPAHRGAPIPSPLAVGDRELDEGEPVYSYGYPLTAFGEPILLSLEQLRDLKLPVEELVGPDGRKLADRGPWPEHLKFSVMNHRLSPRTTSAIIAADIEYYNTFDIQGENSTKNFYVLDKALNYGNSGGPIIASETGRVYALCTRFQPVAIPQRSGETIVIPSLYGVVTRLTHPTIRAALEAEGVVLSGELSC